jgi:predicted histidine transporter YuiF (NhaC family)
VTFKKQTLTTIIFEIAKWGLAILLLWPLLSFDAERMPLWRMVFGVMLLVINFGKIFYDIFLDSFKAKKEQYAWTDLIMLILGVTVMAVIIGGAVLIIGLYVAQQAGSGIPQ